MFKIPNWENDVPKATDTFGKKTKIRKPTLSEKLTNKSEHVNNKIKGTEKLNGIRKNTLKKANSIEKNLEQISQVNKTVNSINYAKDKKNQVNGIKKKQLKNNNIKRIMETIRNVETNNNETKTGETVLTRKVVKAQLKKKGKNKKLLNVNKKESETTVNNLKLDDNSNSNESVHYLKNGIILNKKSKKILDHESCLASSKDNIQSSVNKKEIKCKYNNKTEMRKETQANNSLDGQSLNSDLLDEALINVKKKKLNEAFENDDREDLLFAETFQNMTTIKNKKDEFTTKNEVISNKIIDNNTIKGKTKIDRKKEHIRKMLQNQSHRKSINISGNHLRLRMLERLKAAQFRYLNEKLYTSSGLDAQKLFESDPAAFQTYHEGYQQQLKKWPVNPLDFIVKRIQKMPKTYKIADLGCGEAALSKRIPNTVRSFDLVAMAPGVETCDMAHTPLLTASMDVAVYCLALMGTDLNKYLIEANRILKIGGHLLIAEVESRFEKVEDFTKEVERLGFKLKKLDKDNTVFFFMEFTKIRDPPVKKSKLPMLTLKPCMYKKR